MTGVTGTSCYAAQGDNLRHSHRHVRWHLIVGLFMGLALVAAACGSDDDAGGEGDGGGGGETTTTGEGPERKPVKGGELVFGAESKVATLDVGAASQPADKVVTLGIYDPLTTYVDNEVVPYLAETIEASDDLSTYEMTLREGVTFHDGTPLNADAVVKHFARMQDPVIACACKANADNVASIDTPDGPEGLTLVFNLKTPSVAFPNDVAGSLGYIPSPTAVAASGDNFKNEPVGTGPFKLAEFKPGERVVLEAYDGYWQKDDEGVQLPYLDKLTVIPIADAGQRVAALETGEVDIFQTADVGTVAQAEEKGFGAQKITGSSSGLLLMNNSKPPFDDVRARQAVAYAVSQDVINERVYDGLFTPSYSGFALDSPYYNPDAGSPQYDPDKAAELVEELGGLKFTIVCIPDPKIDTVLQLVKQMGEEAGMEITLETQEQGDYVNRIFSKAGDYTGACFRSAHFIEPDAVRPGLTTDDPGNLTFYSNDEVDELLDKARQTDDFEERKELYFQVQEIVAEDVPLMPILYNLYSNVYDTERVGPPPDGEANSLGAIKPGFLYAKDG